MTVFKIFLFIFLNLVVTFAKISDKRLCFNQDCSEPVSIAKTILGYVGGDSRMLSFKPQQDVKIFSKSAGSRVDLWGAEINGKRGYVPISHIRENKILHADSDLKFLVDTEGEADPAISSSAPKTATETIPTDKTEKIHKKLTEVPKSVKNEIFPNTVTPSFEIIDGTTLYFPDTSDYSSTPNSVDNLVEHSEKQISEHVTEATLPVVLDTKTIVQHVNSETKSSSEKTEQKNYDLSKEQQGNKVNDVSNIKENINLVAQESKEEKEIERVENENATAENKSKEIIYDLSEEQKGNKVDDIQNSKENINLEKQESKEEKVNESVENINGTIENNSNGKINNLSEELIENKVNDVPSSKENNIEKQKSKEEKIIESVENKVDGLPNSSENFSSEKQDSKEVKIIESVETINVNVENKSAEITNLENEEEEEETEDGDGNEDDYNDQEEVPENPEKPVKNDIANAQNNKIVESTESSQTLNEPTTLSSENVDVKSTEIENEILKDNSNNNNENSKSISSKQEQPVYDKVGNILTPSNNSSVETTYTEQLNENITQSDMNQFDAANNESNSFENNSANAEKSAENNEQKIEPGVPSRYPNPLKIFSSHEIQDEQKIEKVKTNTQVPEFSTSEFESNNAVSGSSETLESNVQFSVTTETPIDQDGPLPFDILKESFTENPIILLNDKSPEFIDVQHDSSIKQSELLKDINSDFSFENSDIEFRKNYDSFEYSQNNVGIGSAEDISSNSVIDQSSENSQNIENIQNSSENTSDEPGFLSNIFSKFFGSKQEENTEVDSKENTYNNIDDNLDIEEIKKSWIPHDEENPSEKYLMSEQSDMQSCKAGPDSTCPLAQNQNYIRSENGDINWSYEIPENAYTILLYLTLTAITVLLFSLGYYYIEKRRKDGKLIASINELEKKLLVTTKECHLAQNELKITKEKLESVEDTSCGSNVALETLKEELETVKSTKLELEEQIANLENELEKATETGMEMSQMLNELLTSQSGSEHLMKTINGLQKQLNDQKITLNHTQTKLSEKNTENELLRTELQVTNEKVSHLQAELDKMVVNILSVQEEKSKIENDYESQIEKLTTDHDSISSQLNKELGSLKEQIKKYNSLIEETKRELDIKSNEYDLLKQSMKDIEGVQSNKESMKALLDVSHVKAEVLQLREEKHKLSDKLQKEIEAKLFNEKEVHVMLQEVKILKDKFDEAEKEKVEAETRLEVLSSYFKEREAQYQKEINENESKWMQKEGEATSTIERIKWIQEELQNYKSQNELLKKEILDQEVSLKSQISMLEKKNHENWLLTRQAERKLEESKQEASQLRNRLTIVEKNLNNSSQMNDESMIQNHSNGDVAVSPLHMTNPENPGSPPLLFPHRDHMTTSPPLQLPPFMPPPHGVHGVHFMPPPPLTGVPPFMPPPPPLFPGDHRPPPLGRMSSPPLHGRYSPDSRTYSPYDRDDSPPMSPTYTDDYRRRTPPPNVNHLPPRNYSPYSGGKQRYWDDKMEYRGQQQHHRNKSRPHKGLSSGSGNSDESLENSGRHSGRV